MVSSVNVGTADTATPPLIVRPRQRANAMEPRERRDSGSCDHTESELNGLIFRDVSTNTPSAQQVLGLHSRTAINYIICVVRLERE